MAMLCLYMTAKVNAKWSPQFSISFLLIDKRCNFDIKYLFQSGM